MKCPQNNPDFATFLWKFHTKIPNSHDVDAINLRHIDFNIEITTLEFKLILLTSNLFRVAFNCSCVKLFAIQREFRSIQFHVQNTRGHHLIIFVLECQSFDCLCNDKTSHVLMILELVVGMPIMCTKINSKHKLLMTLWVMLLATNCQKLQLHITKSLMKIMGIQYLFHPCYLK
jgi:hypothetical protein